jgi:hypothetical protein
MNRTTSQKALNRLLKLECEAYQKASEALSAANASSMKVFAALEGHALKTGDINACLEVSDRLTQSAVLVAQVDSLIASVVLQISTLKAFSSTGGLG